MKERLIFALDVEDGATALAWVERLRAEVGLFKVGKQLFTSAGPELVRRIVLNGGQVFLDLKYHDIPNTVAKAAIEALRLGVSMLNVHALGGMTMMQTMSAQVRQVAAAEGRPCPLLLAVTILTSASQSDLQAVGIDRPVTEMVVRLAQLAQAAGLDGVVASAQEAPLIRQACGPDFVIVTPGVRPVASAVDDQQRIMTPAAALAAGADYLVVGRPIAKASDPVQAARAIVTEMASSASA
ncbi:orotidine-5'-phosphate decarboxylase [Desulfuromonas thiophila]|uniref:orotidine-5'-phosphate decarboxylase n=1 Tax=Desulfuromonas thiophila TaxID=57664 RepID=UPI0029F52241|nr:orotidine-5'-phosphate decarboxylase [Desulfuromonas thiophila]